MSAASNPGASIFRRGIRIGAGLLAVAALAIGGILRTGEAGAGSVVFALQETATPALTPTPAPGLHPATTVTATPGVPLPPPGPPAYFSIALLVLLSAGLLAGMLLLAFSRPGAWNGRNLSRFSAGFAGWFLVNTLLWQWLNASVARSSGTLFIHPLAFVPPLVNLAALPVLFLKRRSLVTLGVLTAILVNAIGTLLATPVTAEYAQDVITAILGGVPFFLPPFLPALNIRPGRL